MRRKSRCPPKAIWWLANIPIARDQLLPLDLSAMEALEGLERLLP